jgi:uncharacterized DUF497 family protein
MIGAASGLYGFMQMANVIERVDDRRNYGETRIRALGTVGGVTLHCVYSQRQEVRRIISLRYANRKERDAYRATYPG